MKLTLKTPRLLLRPFRMEDAEQMYRNWAHDPVVTKYLTWQTHETVEDTKAVLAQWISEYEKPERLNFAIERKDNGKLIGGIDVVGYLGGVSGTPVIGYNLSQSEWNQGFMTEACRCLLEYLFRHGYAQVSIDAMAENKASIRVIEKCGGIFQKTEEETLPMKDCTVLVNRYLIKNFHDKRSNHHGTQSIRPQ